MSLYYFDTYDGDEPVVDDEGLDFADLDTVKLEAVRGLADLAETCFPAANGAIGRDSTTRRSIEAHLKDRCDLRKTQMLI